MMLRAPSSPSESKGSHERLTSDRKVPGIFLPISADKNAKLLGLLSERWLPWPTCPIFPARTT